eukprot:355018-Chlamydomonas_euryale.AAC.7
MVWLKTPISCESTTPIWCGSTHANAGNNVQALATGRFVCVAVLSYSLSNPHRLRFRLCLDGLLTEAAAAAAEKRGERGGGDVMHRGRLPSCARQRLSFVTG